MPICQVRTWSIPSKKLSVWERSAHPNLAPRCLSGQGCNPIIMPLNTRWPAGFSSPTWCWCKQATQGTRKSKVVRTCCVLHPPLPCCTKTPPTQIRLYAPFPLSLRPHEKPRSRKQLGKKHNLTISDKNIKLIKILPKVKCWMLMRKGGDVILFGWHEARYCDKWVVGGMMVCKQGVPN